MVREQYREGPKGSLTQEWGRNRPNLKDERGGKKSHRLPRGSKLRKKMNFREGKKDGNFKG